MTIFNREAELTEPQIRLFQYSPDTMKELLPALTKCLDAKRKIKSNSLEAIIYRALGNLTNPKDRERVEQPFMEEESDGWLISHSAMAAQVRKILYGEDIHGRDSNDAFYCSDLGKVTHRDIFGRKRLDR